MSAFIAFPASVQLVIRSLTTPLTCTARKHPSPFKGSSKQSTLPTQFSGGHHNNGNNGNNGNNNLTKFVFDDDRDDTNHNDPNRYKFLLFCGLHAPSLAFLVSLRGSRLASQRRPKLYISHIILALNVLIFIYQYYNPAVLMAGAKVNSAIAYGEYYRLVSPVFVHASTTHLLVNSFSLNSTGPSVESWFGKRRFMFLYFISGICGNYLSYLCNPNPAVGASGAIFGLVGATGVMLARHNNLMGNRGRRALTSLMYIVITNFGMGMIPGSRIDNFGHLGGFLGGIAYSYLFGPNLKIRYTRSGRPMVFDRPVISQVQRDVKKRIEQTFRLLKSITN